MAGRAPRAPEGIKLGVRLWADLAWFYTLGLIVSVSLYSAAAPFYFSYITY